MMVSSTIKQRNIQLFIIFCYNHNDGPSSSSVFYNNELFLSGGIHIHVLMDFSFPVLCSGFPRFVGFCQALEGVAEISWGGPGFARRRRRLPGFGSFD